ncbi:MAG: 3-deoxy-D-manno-octulosonic acid kinase [Proteobacteria bacterium]|nr:3-deoxy-D-manno-octulosonic acid kinase [Pseudomonadota bacterium]
MTETVEKTETGAILYDRSIISEIDEERFVAAGWSHAEPVTGSLGSAGRGNTMFVGNVPRQFVLRHYVRGGLIGRLIDDTYIWTGERNSRPFVEWRMLAKMAENGLRVPRPAAARYRRIGPFYTADLITVRIPGVQPLSVRIGKRSCGAVFWQSIGNAIAQFHADGVYHADMNAYNLQIDDEGELWMLDLDRGRLLSPGPWQQKTLSRLHRSLEKIKALDPNIHYTQENWEQFLEGYFDALRSA